MAINSQCVDHSAGEHTTSHPRHPRLQTNVEHAREKTTVEVSFKN
jgi:hypothetical protein